MKIIVCIRNPIDQLFSLYKHKLRFLEIDENESFYSFVSKQDEYYRQYYDLHLAEWFNVFGDDIKCIFFDALIKNPSEVLTDVIDWLELAPLPLADSVLSNTNPGGTYKHKFTHQIALSIFHKIKAHLPHSVFLRLRKVYFALNGKRVRHSLDQDAKTHLESHFSSHNQALLDLLKSRGYTDLPQWLTGSGD